ncbi:MAG: hypothetical protein JSV89_07240 [Spirochaetaceae bacterium]|nr:MAG: hypothetical protein JSV89_07240 [Spirochaetaceae bacterium]
MTESETGKNEALHRKFRFYEEFWKGEGPCPILFTEPHLAKGKPYKRHDLVEQHRDLEKHLEERLLEVQPHLELIDDGIPTVRSDLGTTLLPSGLGLRIEVQPELHPWLAENLAAETYAELAIPFQQQKLLKNEVLFSQRFYELFKKRKGEGLIPADVFPYVPDTQGIFDLSHLIVGTDLLYLLTDRREQVLAIQERSLELFLATTRLFKELLGERNGSMVHGHGMPIGVWFPDSGARISEDSATLISTDMIRTFCQPFIRRAAEPFGRLFMHYCGHHPGFLQMLCEMQEISTLNLGNPEMYDLEELFSLCGQSGTVYFGHLPLLDGEDGRSYLERLADLCGRHITRLILVSDYHPVGSEEKSTLVERWHSLTAR